jgi:hypothetical protein
MKRDKDGANKLNLVDGTMITGKAIHLHNTVVFPLMLIL